MNREERQKYNDWNEKKQSLQSSVISKKIYFKEADVWWCSLGLNLGSESFGKGDGFRRPILIVRKLSSDLCIALPLTSKEKNGTWFIDITLHTKKRWVMLYQIRALHKKRFQHKIGELDATDFNRVKQKLQNLLESSSKSSPHRSGDRRE